MGLIYTMPFDAVATGAVANTYNVIADILAPDTAGTRAQLRKIFVGFADATPQDLNVGLQIKRVLDISAGSAGVTPASTIAATAMPKAHPSQRDTLMTGHTGLYATEPSTFEANPPWPAALNAHGALIDVWDSDDDLAPWWEQDMMIAILAAPRTNQALKVTGYLQYEEK